MDLVQLGRPLAILQQLGKGFKETGIRDFEGICVLNLDKVVLVDVRLVVELDIRLRHELNAEHRRAVPLHRRLLQNLNSQNFLSLPIAHDFLGRFLEHDLDRHVFFVQKRVKLFVLLVNSGRIKLFHLLKVNLAQPINVEILVDRLVPKDREYLVRPRGRAFSFGATTSLHFCLKFKFLISASCVECQSASCVQFLMFLR